jgi:hypothetical protein
VAGWREKRRIRMRMKMRMKALRGERHGRSKNEKYVFICRPEFSKW